MGLTLERSSRHRILIRRSALAVGVLAAILCLGGMGCRFLRASPPNLLVVTIDTLRADRVGAYGDPAADTPTLDGLADRGCLFETCYSAVPLTLPSHCSIFTGLYPGRLNVRYNGTHVLAEDHTTMAEFLSRKGYDTGAVIGAFVLDRRFGLAQGFDWYEDDIEKSSTGRSAAKGGFAERQAQEITDKALGWLKGRKNRFFLWVHYYDPHANYLPPEPYRSRFELDLYDGEIAYTDACLKPLLDAVPEDTIVVVVSDHGEGLGEHGFKSHGIFVYDDTLRVPFIMAGPGIPKGKTVLDPVKTADIAPTVLGLMGWPDAFPRALDGQNLEAVMNGVPGSEPHAIYSECGGPLYQNGWSPITSLREGPWKFIQAPRPELYNTQEDPFELLNLYDLETGKAKDLAKGLSEVVSQWPDFEDVSVQEMPLDVKKKLEGLGYVSAPVDQERTVQRPDPKDMMEVDKMMNLFKNVVRLSLWPQEQQLDFINRIVEKDPDGKESRVQRAMLWLKMGNFSKVEEEIAWFQSEASFSLGAFFKGAIVARQGDVAGSLIYFQRARSNAIVSIPADMAMVDAHGYLGNLSESMDCIERCILADPFGQVVYYTMLACCYEELGRYEEAITTVQKVLKEEPDHPEALAIIQRCTEGMKGKML